MIYLTGDTHGEFHRFNTTAFPEQRDMTKDDYVIICGDFGCIWEAEGESKQEKYWLDWFEERPYTLLFIDGNHENFERIYSYPEKEWNGGRVHEIRPHVLHLCRGQVFEIDSKTIFTFGGAASHDISGGILEPDDPEFRKKKKLLDRDWISYRINHISWWKQEMASGEEMEEGLVNLARFDNSVDFIVTHCCSSSTQDYIGGKGLYAHDRMTDYFERIKNTVMYTKWFFGHYHMNKNVNDKEILIYEQLIRMS
ncbi:Calcineurin-like phosphoesterase [Lachnospiraceae bacterium XBB2008]|nr:Calcineurin-like phosphoesterase [Lachnospiraceae bacterium XBB2008]